MHENNDLVVKQEGSLGVGIGITTSTLKPSYGFSTIESRKIKPYDMQGDQPYISKGYFKHLHKLLSDSFL